MNFRTTKQFKARLDDFAERLGLSATTVIEGAVNEAIKNGEVTFREPRLKPEVEQAALDFIERYESGDHSDVYPVGFTDVNEMFKHIRSEEGQAWANS
jgi:antitoxin component of RelBE/YafQ-DinJ toxin-antitoxin module